MEFQVNPRKRFIVVLAIIFGVIGFILLFVRYDLSEVFQLNYPILLIINFLFIFISIFLFAYLYLQGNLTISSSLRAAITFNLDNSIGYAIKSLSDIDRNIMTAKDLGKYRLGINRVYKLLKSINSSIKNL